MENLIQNFILQIQTGEVNFLLLPVAFIGGIIASISPCTLGILPIIIAYMGGYNKEKKILTNLIQLVSFILGLSIILTVIGVICALTGKVFAAFGGEYFVVIMASLILLFGLNLLGVVELPTPKFIKQMPKSNNKSVFFYPFILGVFFALAATPCSTPILASIMSFATLTKDIFYASLLLLCFSLGQGIIIIFAGIFASFVKNMRILNKYSEMLIKICGILLILSSIYLLYNSFSQFLNFN